MIPNEEALRAVMRDMESEIEIINRQNVNVDNNNVTSASKKFKKIKKQFLKKR